MEIMKHVMLFHWSVHKVLIYVKLMTYVYIYIVHVIESIDILCQTFRKPFDSVVSRGDVMFNHGQRSAQPKSVKMPEVRVVSFKSTWRWYTPED